MLSCISSQLARFPTPLRAFSLAIIMAKSKYEYVRNFETSDSLLPNCWIVVRVDGKNFHDFADKHKFEKPNDLRALNLMNKAAESVLKNFKDVCLAYGQSDEYSFVVRKSTESYKRRQSKFVSLITSTFTSSYVYYWSEHFPDTKLLYPPCFDGRAVLYPSTKNLKDYLSWRQVDCHINNLYNLCFWKLVLVKELSRKEADIRLQGTLSGDKNELLFSQFGINYNEEPQIYRKGSVVTRKKVTESSEGDVEQRTRTVIKIYHVDIIGEQFWKENPQALGKDGDT